MLTVLSPSNCRTAGHHFFSKFEPILAAVAHTNAYIIGDFNFNLLKNDNNNSFYWWIMRSHGFHLCNSDDTPTRGLAVLDHIYLYQDLKYHNIIVMEFVSIPNDEQSQHQRTLACRSYFFIAFRQRSINLSIQINYNIRSCYNKVWSLFEHHRKKNCQIFFLISAYYD